MKKFLVIAIAAAVFLTSAVAVFADGLKTPAEILSGLTGKSADELYAEKEAGETFGSVAAEEGVLDQFKAQMLEQKKAVVEQRVKDGTLTRENADALIEAIEENAANCDGTGNSVRLGEGCGTGLGMGQGTGLGAGRSTGAGRGVAAGRGRGLASGKCSR